MELPNTPAITVRPGVTTKQLEDAILSQLKLMQGRMSGTNPNIAYDYAHRLLALSAAIIDRPKPTISMLTTAYEGLLTIIRASRPTTIKSQPIPFFTDNMRKSAAELANSIDALMQELAFSIFAIPSTDDSTTNKKEK